MVFDKFFDTVGGFIQKGGLQTVNGLVNTFAPIIRSSAQNAAFPQGTASNVTPPTGSYAGNLAFGGTGTVTVGTGSAKVPWYNWFIDKTWGIAHWVIVLIVIVIAGVFYYFFKKRKRR